MKNVRSPSLRLDLHRQGFCDDSEERVENAEIVEGGGRIDGFGDGTVADGRENADLQHGGQILGTDCWQNAAQKRESL